MLIIESFGVFRQIIMLIFDMEKILQSMEEKEVSGNETTSGLKVITIFFIIHLEIFEILVQKVHLNLYYCMIL